MFSNVYQTSNFFRHAQLLALATSDLKESDVSEPISNVSP